jgi:hypothetical protein
MHRLHAFMTCRCRPKDYTADKERLGAEHWLKRHLHFVLLRQAERNNEILQNLAFHRTISEDVDLQWASKGHMNGMDLCWQRCMPFLYGTSRTSLGRLRKDFKDGKQKPWEHGSRQVKMEPCDLKGGKVQAIINWLKALKINFAEATPDQLSFELPPGSKASYWEDYAVASRLEKKQEAHYSYFQRIWRGVFPNLLVPKEVRWVRQHFVFLIALLF